MTIAPSPSINVILPTGTALGPWPTGFTYADPADVQVSLETGGVAAGALIEGIDYTLAATDPRQNGGEVTLFARVLPSGGWTSEHRLIIRRRTLRRQGLALPDAEGHKPRATERSLDHAMRIAQEDRDDLDRAVTVAPGEEGYVLPRRQARVGRTSVLGSNTDGDLVMFDRSEFKGDPGGTSDLIGTRAQAKMMVIGAEFDAVRTTGFASAGDGGAALYRRISTGSDADGDFQSADGQWWGLADATVAPEMGGALADGGDDSAAIAVAMEAASARAAPLVGRRYRYGAAGGALMVPAGLLVQGVSLDRVTGAGPVLRVDAPGVTLADLRLDNRASEGARAGHVIRATGDDLTVRNVKVLDFGNFGGSGGGTGVLVFNDGAGRPQRPRLFDSYIRGNLASPDTIGWIFDSTDYGFVGHVLTEDTIGTTGIGFGHELKFNARFTNMHALTAVNAESGYANGGESAGTGNGAAYNLLTGLVGAKVGYGYDDAWGRGNVLVGAVVHADGRPAGNAQSYALRLAGAVNGHYAGINAFGSGADARAVIIERESSGNYVSVSGHVEGTYLVRLADTPRSNAIEITHPGSRTSILGTVLDTSGAPSHGAGANPIWCHATGERLGSLSGRFRDYLGDPGVSFNAGHRFQQAREGNVVQAMGTPATAGMIAGFVHATPANNAVAQFIHLLEASEAGNRWSMSVAGAARYAWTATEFRPEADNVAALGASSFRFTQLFAAAGSINTSDEREKQDIGEIPDVWLDAWGDVQWRRFKWKDAVVEKGPAARWHVGLIAQRIRDAFAARGLDAFEIGLLCYDEWQATEAVVLEDEDEESGQIVRTEVVPARTAGDRYGVRYDEALAMEAAWVRRALARIEAAA